VTASTIGRLVAALPLLALGACAIPAHQPAADAAFAAQAKAATVDPAKARLYLYPGERDAWFGLSTGNRMPADVQVNGITVGGVNRGECLVVDVPPGRYRVSWSARNDQFDLPIRSDDHPITLAPGEPAYLSFDIHDHVGEAFGVLGLMMTPPTGHIIDHPVDGHETVESLKIVLPDPAAVAQLHPIASAPGS
jgi:hypothetical protein